MNLREEVRKFWGLNNLPVELLFSVGKEKYRLVPNQIEEAILRVYAEAQEILEDTAEPTSFHSERAIEKIILARNKLHPSRLGRRVYEVAKTIPPEVRRRRSGNEEILVRLAAIEAQLNRRRWLDKLINWSKYSRWE